MANLKQKYFIALVPPEPEKSKLYLLKEQFAKEYNTRGALRSPAHITLHMPFEYNEKKEEVILNFLQLFSQSIQSFNVELQGYGCFEPKVIFAKVVNNENLMSLFDKLSEQIKPTLQLFNSDYKGHGFHPHLTLAFRDLKKPLFYLAWQKYKDKELEYTFNCDSLALLKHNGKSWEVYKEFYFSK